MSSQKFSLKSNGPETAGRFLFYQKSCFWHTPMWYVLVLVFPHLLFITLLRVKKAYLCRFRCLPHTCVVLSHPSSCIWVCIPCSSDHVPLCKHHLGVSMLPHCYGMCFVFQFWPIYILDLETFYHRHHIMLVLILYLHITDLVSQILPNLCQYIYRTFSLIWSYRIYH